MSPALMTPESLTADRTFDITFTCAETGLPRLVALLARRRLAIRELAFGPAAGGAAVARVRVCGSSRQVAVAERWVARLVEVVSVDDAP